MKKYRKKSRVYKNDKYSGKKSQKQTKGQTIPYSISPPLQIDLTHTEKPLGLTHTHIKYTKTQHFHCQ